jgi:hypothetical protein
MKGNNEGMIIPKVRISPVEEANNEILKLVKIK